MEVADRENEFELCDARGRLLFPCWEIPEKTLNPALVLVLVLCRFLELVADVCELEVSFVGDHLRLGERGPSHELEPCRCLLNTPLELLAMN